MMMIRRLQKVASFRFRDSWLCGVPIHIAHCLLEEIPGTTGGGTSSAHLESAGPETKGK